MNYIFIEVKDEKHEHDLSPIMRVRRGFSERGKVHDFIFRSVLSEAEAEDVMRGYIGKYGDGAVFFACGDNRAVSAAVNVLAFTDIPLGIVPYGKCDLAGIIYGEDADAESVCEMLSLREKPRMRIKHADVGEANGALFTNCLSIGFDEKRLSDAEKIYAAVPLSRRLSRKAAFASALWGKKRWKARLSFDVWHQDDADGSISSYESEREFSLLSVTNSGFSEGRKISDRSNIYDGRFELCIISPCNFAEYSNVNELYKRGVADISEKAELMTITGGKISSADETPLTFITDGKKMTDSEIKITIHRKALRICAPFADETEKTP